MFLQITQSFITNQALVQANTPTPWINLLKASVSRIISRGPVKHKSKAMPVV